MKILINSKELKLHDENMYPPTTLYVSFCKEFRGGSIDFSTTREDGSQHDMSLTKKDWELVKDYIDQKIKENTKENTDEAEV